MTSPRLHLWGWPIALGFLSATGLASALISDSWGDAWSWVALGIPVAVMAWFGLRRPNRGPSNPRTARNGGLEQS
jgi:hypothetical protein